MPVIINSFISSALVVLLMYLDRYEKENIITMVKIFVIAILATGLYSSFISFMPDFGNFVGSVIIAPVLEELLKFILFIIVWKLYNNELNESFDAIMFIGMIAVGFAFYENIAYYLNALRLGAVFASVTSDFSFYHQSMYRIFLARIIPGHLLFDMIAITVFGMHYKSKNAVFYLFPAFFIAVFLHAVWNLMADNVLLFSIYALILLAIATFCVKKLLNASEFKLESEIGDELKDYDQSGYDWSYYLISYIFLIIAGIIAIFTAYYLGIWIKNILIS